MKLSDSLQLPSFFRPEKQFCAFAPMPKWTIDKESAKDLVQMVTVDGKLQQMGVPLGMKAMQAKYGVDEVQGDDTVLTPAAAAATLPNLTAADQTTFAAHPEEVIRATADIAALMKQLKGEAGAAYAQRIRALSENPWLGGAQ